MNIETIINVYLAICLAMIVFNIVCIFVFRHKDNRVMKVNKGFEEKIRYEIDRLKSGVPVQESHKKYLRRKLKRIGNMMEFDQLMDKMNGQDTTLIYTYLAELKSVFAYLTMEYMKKDKIEIAYYSYIIKKYKIIRGRQFDDLIVNAMLELLNESSLYCRENAMQALYTTEDCSCIIRALKIIDNSGRFYHSKLISDGLLEFSGDHKELAENIMNSFLIFSTNMQLALLSFLRFDSSQYADWMLKLMNDESQDEEIRFSCIRYFGKYRYDDAFSSLLIYADSNNDLRWEYTAIASSALALYPSEVTNEVLMKNLENRNWYIRYNASYSLEQLGLS